MTSLLLIALAQAPTDVPVAIVISSRRDATNAAPVVVEQLKAALAAVGITATGDAESAERLGKLGGVDPKACDGARLCLQKLAQLLQGVVIGIDCSKAGKLTAGHLEAVAYDRVDSLAVDDVTSDAKGWAAKTTAAATAFAAKVKGPIFVLNDARAASAAPPPPKPVATNDLKTGPVLEAPKPTLVPEPPPRPPASEPVLVATEPKANLGPVAYVTTGAAILAVGGGILCLVLGFIDRGQYVASFQQPTNMGGFSSSKNDTELQGLASLSNTRIIIGGSLVGVAAALGLTAGILYAKE